MTITTAGIRNANPPPGDEVVITGLSGSFPDSDGVYQFRDNLMNKFDMVNDDDRRWATDHPEIPGRSGKIFNIEKFDASFFGVHFKQAHSMDPMCRILLEKAYEAIIDAGFHPKELRGTRTGVYVGACFSESEKTWFYEKIQIDGFGITGCSRAMLANRVSYWLGVNGPSYSIDTACSSSLYALEHAYRAIRDGICDSAIVGGVNLCLTPFVTLQFSRLGVLSMDGKCRSFDNDGSGYVRSEAVAAIFLQKSKDSRRIYGRVCHAKTNCDGYKPEGITYPSGQMQRELLESFYEECPVPAHTLAYVEAHGTGTKVGDPEEGNTLDLIFCKNRTTPLKIGSVKSNIGHSEPASGLCSIAKVILAFETGIIPPNLHYKAPRKGITALEEGRMVVVADPTPLEGSYIGINSFGFGGANCHILLKKNEKEKINGGAPLDDIPRLVCVSGRTEEAVQVMLDDIESRPLDAEFVRLLQEVHKYDIFGHVYRGYTLLQKGEPRVIARETDYFADEKRPIWFVFSGMGSQWSGMGSSLMKIPVFAAAIEKCDKVLAPRGIDIVKIITSDDPKMFDNILHSFVGIAAIQIGLVDVLNQLGIVPDNIIGHSVGELGCAYADNCFTAEQMILAAYCRGIASIETELIRGAMAAVGLGYKEVRELVPPEIDVACHNSSDSSTISGPADVMAAFVKSLQEKGIFAREVNASNIAYHSRYIAGAGPRLLKELSKVIPEPKLRSSKWISSSVPKSQWHTDLAKYSSAEYHTNNLLCPVLFEESSREIPANAITIEIAPHGLLQAILRRSLPSTVVNVALTSRGKDNTNVLLTAIGKLYKEGIISNLIAFYPKVEFPVSRGTPMISPLVRWEHTDDWHVAFFEKKSAVKSGERIVRISCKSEEHNYITGHVIDGRNLYPATGYLHLVWESFAIMRGDVMEEMSVMFEDIRFLRATNIPKSGEEIEFVVMIQKGTGHFEIVESETAIVSGKISIVENIDKELVDLPKPEPISNKELLPLTSKDFYKELRLRGYNYNGIFKGVMGTDGSAHVAKIQWIKNYVAFMDNMLQLHILHEESRNLYVPTSIQRIVINPQIHQNFIEQVEDSDEDFYVTTYLHKEVGIIRAGGIEIRGLKANSIPRRKPLGDPVLERQVFVPFYNPDELTLIDAMRILIQLALDNTPAIKIKTVELDSGVEDPLALAVHTVLGDLPLIQAETIVISNRDLELPSTIKVEDKKASTESHAHFVIDSDLINRPDALKLAKTILKDNGYIISRENISNKPNEPNGFSVLAEVQVGGEKLVLLRPKAIVPEFIAIEINSDPSFPWLENVKKAVKDAQPVVLYSYNDPLNGLVGFVNCLRKEPGGDLVSSVFVVDPTAPRFDSKLPFYKQQLDKKLPINIYKNGRWGCLRHLELHGNTVLTNHAYVDIETRGDLSTLKWFEGPLSNKADDNMAEIYYSALNFRDVMTATGKIGTDFIKQTYTSFDCIQGLEFSGRDNKGNRIMGMVAGGALATRIQFDKSLVWPVPDEWSLEDAATVPVAYGTVYYALVCKGGMKRGQKVLIHAGSGGVGQAGIRLALYYGCTVFTTVGTPEKRAFIKQRFPELLDRHIGNSRDTSFEQMILRETNGEGVDLILNSLAEEKLQASLRCLAQGGKFLEIGKYDLSNNNSLGMEMFLKETSFHGVMLDNVFYMESEEKARLSEYLTEGIKNGAIKPLTRIVFAEDEVEPAFRYMAAGKHIGKVLINIRPDEKQKNIVPRNRLVSANPKLFCSPEQSVVIVGGLGGFGLELTDWLIKRGLKKIVLSSRNGLCKGYQSLRIRKWRYYGIDVKISTADVTTLEGCTALIHAAKLMGPVFAIFNLAAVLRDALLENQTVEDFKISFGGKVYGTKNLDEISRSMCPTLKHFVVFSSVSCGRGNAGQTNYGMANSVMERVCEKRRAEGLPGLAIQWGAIGEVGLVADMQDNDTQLEIGGTLQQKLHSCLKVLDSFLAQEESVVASMVVAEKKHGVGSGGTIVSCVADILGVRDLKTISMHSSLAELGMDSMMAVEIKQTLEREYEIFLTAQDIRTLTFAKLVEIQGNQEINGAVASTQSAGTDLGTLIRTLGDEKMRGQVVVPLISAIAASVEESPVFFLAGIEGQSSVFETVCQKLNIRAIGLQISFDNPARTVEDIAESITPIVRANLKPGEQFKLVAYSFGSMVANEVILQLESEGHKGKILFIDGSPSLMKAIVHNQFVGATDSEFETALLCNIMYLISPANLTELKMEFDMCDDWNSKLDVFLSRVPENNKYSPEYRRILCNGALNRVRAITDYKPNISRKIESPILLVRPTIAIVTDIAEDYELALYTKTPSKITIIEGNHFTILDNPALSTIINDYFNTK